MAGEQPVDHSGQRSEDARGVLFGIGARLALVVFAGVLAVGLMQGRDPTLALIRALVALVSITATGWLAEHIAGSARAPTSVSRPAPEAERSEPELTQDE